MDSDIKIALMAHASRAVFAAGRPVEHSELFPADPGVYGCRVLTAYAKRTIVEVMLSFKDVQEVPRRGGGHLYSVLDADRLAMSVVPDVVEDRAADEARLRASALDPPRRAMLYVALRGVRRLAACRRGVLCVLPSLFTVDGVKRLERKVALDRAWQSRLMLALEGIGMVAVRPADDGVHFAYKVLDPALLGDLATGANGCLYEVLFPESVCHLHPPAEPSGAREPVVEFGLLDMDVQFPSPPPTPPLDKLYETVHDGAASEAFATLASVVDKVEREHDVFALQGRPPASALEGQGGPGLESFAGVCLAVVAEYGLDEECAERMAVVYRAAAALRASGGVGSVRRDLFPEDDRWSRTILSKMSDAGLMRRTGYKATTRYHPLPGLDQLLGGEFAMRLFLPHVLHRRAHGLSTPPQAEDGGSEARDGAPGDDQDVMKAFLEVLTHQKEEISLLKSELTRVNAKLDAIIQLIEAIR